jgi:hypothetical protein
MIVLAFICTASAQRKYGVKKTIVLKPGTNSTRIVSDLRSSLEVHEYHFRAKAHQRMRVDLVSNDKNIGFYIMTIPDGYVITEDIAVRSFNDTLPDTGEYKLIVETDTRRGSRYALEITIEP